MNSQRPYLIRAILDWILDNGCTPYIVIDTREPGPLVPREHIQNERIVLNISPNAVRNFSIDESQIAFDSRFSGRPHHVSAPVGTVTAIYAKENGQGMIFEFESPTTDPTDIDSSTDKTRPTAEKASHLQVVK